MHYVDVGPRDGNVMLLMHGMPTWSYLYRDMIPALTAARYRCIAPDFMGFDRSDKPTDIHWYTIARHTEILTTPITALDFNDITLVSQDWGGSIGLAQAVHMPERFERLVIMNTWLHHPTDECSCAIKFWNKNWQDGGIFHHEQPDLGLVVATMGYGGGAEKMFSTFAEKTQQAPTDGAADCYNGFSAPYRGLPDEAFNGFRRFPLSIPVSSYDNGNGAGQTHHFETLKKWSKPAHFIWGIEDLVFTEAWGREWAGPMNASFDPIPGANHFLQDTHGKEVAAQILARAGG